MPPSIDGPTRVLDNGIAHADQLLPLPSLQEADPLYIFSDYGGEHQDAGFKTYSFFLCDLERNSLALAGMKAVSERFLQAKRSLDFKKISNEDGRMNALKPFWDAVRSGSGLAVTVGVDERLGTLVRTGTRPDYADIDVELLARVDEFSPIRQEHLHRVLHFVGLLLGGVTRKNQRVHWITDRDKLMDAQEVLQKGCQNLFSQYAPHLTGLDISVDEVSTVPQVKHLMWIPDHLAGAWCERLSQIPGRVAVMPSGLAVTGGAALSKKTLAILNGSTTRSSTFRSWTCSLRSAGQEGRMRYQVEWDSAEGQIAL